MFKKFLVITILISCLTLPAIAFSDEMKLGFVDMKKLFYDYEKTKDFNKKLEKEDENAKQDIEEKSKKLMRLRDEVNLLSEEARKKKEPELQEAMRELETYRREKVESFLRKKDEMFQEIREDIMKVASKYADKNEYDVILDGAVFVHSSDKYDLTEGVLKELNKK